MKKIIDLTKPQFKHDCDDCVFLGRYTYVYDVEGTTQSTKYDLYVHAKDRHQTVIARYGDDGDYISGLAFIHVSTPLKEAFDRATARGIKLSEY